MAYDFTVYLSALQYSPATLRKHPRTLKRIVMYYPHRRLKISSAKQIEMVKIMIQIIKVASVPVACIFRYLLMITSVKITRQG